MMTTAGDVRIIEKSSANIPADQRPNVKARDFLTQNAKKCRIFDDFYQKLYENLKKTIDKYDFDAIIKDNNKYT